MQERMVWDDKSTLESVKVDKEMDNLYDYEVLFGVSTISPIATIQNNCPVQPVIRNHLIVSPSHK